MLLKEIGRKIAQVFRLARAADEKVASSIAGAGCQGGANKGIRKALRTRTSGTGSFTGSTRITGAGWIQCSSRHICAPEICRKPETRATKPSDKQLAQDARSADASKTCIVQEKKEVPRWAEGHGARRN